MLTAIVFIIILGLLIFVHELGHFLVARRNGIRAEEFGFGFPPRIVGLQPLVGRVLKKISRREEIEVHVSDTISDNGEVIKEKITDKIKEIDQVVPVTKWRWIFGKKIKNKSAKYKDFKEGTIYSLNWIPLGGFVKIKGEDGSDKKEKDSFASKSAWIRIKVLAAGVIMNFVLAWLLLSLAFMVGTPQEVMEGTVGSNVQIAGVAKESPAEIAGIKDGDIILESCVNGTDCQKVTAVSQFQNLMNANKGNEITLKVGRGKSTMNLKVTPRLNPPEGQGPVGVTTVQTAIVKFPWYEAISKGLFAIFNAFVLIFGILRDLIAGKDVSVQIGGPVLIAVYTRQVTELGFNYILQFAALLSINLGIINGFPFPALDGGRILFILIEKVKGSPVSQKAENFVHTVGFALLILLMIYVTFSDVLRLQILDKLKGIF